MNESWMTEFKLDVDLSSNIGKMVLVKLKNNMEFRGIFRGFDEYINIVLSDAEEVVADGVGRKFDKLIFKGGLVGFLTPSE